jgi:hypothetical protein
MGSAEWSPTGRRSARMTGMAAVGIVRDFTGKVGMGSVGTVDDSMGNISMVSLLRSGSFERIDHSITNQS